MKFEEYKEQVKRTLPKLGDFNGNPLILDSLHMSVGMFSEIYELNTATTSSNLREEITDILWYACNYANVRNIELVSSVIFEGDPETPLSKIFENIDNAYGKLINAISELQDYDKKEFAYGKSETTEIRERRIKLINRVVSCINDLYFWQDLNGEEAMEQNINKLKQRYPDKFDAEKAINRDTDAEKIHLGN